MDGWTDGWMDGWMDGYEPKPQYQINVQCIVPKLHLCLCIVSCRRVKECSYTSFFLQFGSK
jgi:hypothetical protein